MVNKPIGRITLHTDEELPLHVIEIGIMLLHANVRINTDYVLILNVKVLLFIVILELPPTNYFRFGPKDFFEVERSRKELKDKVCLGNTHSPYSTSTQHQLNSTELSLT